MLTFVCWKWAAPSGYRSQFTARSVLALQAMLDRHYRRPHRLVCVTDDPTGLTSTEGLTVLPLWDDYAHVENPSGPHNPSCYRRLKAFSAEASQWFGDRFVSLDLDVVIVSDITTLFDRPEDFVIWGESDYPASQWYNGSVWLLRSGTRTKVWTEFDPQLSPGQAHRAGARGSDQGWLSYVLGPKEATFGRPDGVYSYRKHVMPTGGVLPGNAKIICFHGPQDPWSPEPQKLHWVRDNWGMV